MNRQDAKVAKVVQVNLWTQSLLQNYSAAFLK